MGTRADFYVGKGSDAEWIGSIAWDGYPEGIAPRIFTAKTEKTYRKRVEAFFENDRNDVTRPKDGWPWPWEDSCTTDYAYTFHKGKVYVSSFGARYIPFKTFKRVNASETLSEKWMEKDRKETFPNMKERQKVTLGRRCRWMVIGSTGPIDGLD
jgi:hypothetical protein